MQHMPTSCSSMACACALLLRCSRSAAWPPPRRAPSSNLTRPQPVAVTMLPKRSDPVLRFFDMCPAYQQHEDTMERWMVGAVIALHTSYMYGPAAGMAPAALLGFSSVL
jgi:hypothetical protein